MVKKTEAPEPRWSNPDSNIPKLPGRRECMAQMEKDAQATERLLSRRPETKAAGKKRGK